MSRLFITGGTGFLGQELIKTYYNKYDITIFSRDEYKQYMIKKQYPNIRCIIGDIRNYDLLKKSSINHNIGIFTASMKQISSVNENITEAIDIIINGTINSRRISEENNFESAVFISTDKSRSPTTLYGAMKFVAGESFIINSELSTVKLSSLIYGNVLNSTGSIIPIIWNYINNKKELPLYSKHMTRFILHVNDAISLIEYSLNMSGYNIIPRLKSFRVLDLFEIYREKFGLKYYISCPRISEKIHETLISEEESYRVKYDDNNDIYLMHYNNIYNDLPFTFSSKDNLIDINELDKLLNNYNYFMI